MPHCHGFRTYFISSCLLLISLLLNGCSQPAPTVELHVQPGAHQAYRIYAATRYWQNDNVIDTLHTAAQIDYRVTAQAPLQLTATGHIIAAQNNQAPLLSTVTQDPKGVPIEVSMTQGQSSEFTEQSGAYALLKQFLLPDAAAAFSSEVLPVIKQWPLLPQSLTFKQGSTLTLAGNQTQQWQVKMSALTADYAYLTFSRSNEEQQRKLAATVIADRHTGWLVRMALLSERTDPESGITQQQRILLTQHQPFTPALYPLRTPPETQQNKGFSDYRSWQHHHNEAAFSAPAGDSLLTSPVGLWTSPAVSYHLPGSYRTFVTLTAPTLTETTATQATSPTRTLRDTAPTATDIFTRTFAVADEAKTQPTASHQMMATLNYFAPQKTLLTVPLSQKRVIQRTDHGVTAELVAQSTGKWQLTLYGQPHARPSLANVSSLNNAQISNHSVAYPELNTSFSDPADQAFLNRGHYRLSYLLDWGKTAPPKALRIPVWHPAKSATFHKQIHFYNEAQASTFAEFAPITTQYLPRLADDENTGSRGPELTADAPLLQMQLPRAQRSLCQLTSYRITADGRQEEWPWRTVETLPNGPVSWQLPLKLSYWSGSQPEHFSLHTTLTCAGRPQWQTLPEQQGIVAKRPWLIDSQQLPDFNGEMTRQELLTHYQFIDGNGQPLLPYQRLNERHAAGSAAQSAGDMLLADRYLRVHGYAYRIRCLTSDQHAFTRSWQTDITVHENTADVVPQYEVSTYTVPSSIK